MIGLGYSIIDSVVIAPIRIGFFGLCGGAGDGIFDVRSMADEEENPSLLFEGPAAGVRGE
jgi:hypothetical protein